MAPRQRPDDDANPLRYWEMMNLPAFFERAAEISKFFAAIAGFGFNGGDPQQEKGASSIDAIIDAQESEGYSNS
jgi:hypothetical protein